MFNIREKLKLVSFIAVVLVSTFRWNCVKAAQGSKWLDPDWDNIALSISDIESQIQQKNCALSERHFFGCIAAVNRWAAVVAPSAQVVPQRDVEIGALALTSSGSAPLKRFDRLVLVKRSQRAGPLTVRSAKIVFESHRKNLEDFYEQYIQLASAFVAKPSDEFERIVNYFKLMNTDSTTISKRQIAEIISAYSKYAVSPHDYLLSKAEMNRRESGLTSQFGFGFEAIEQSRGILVRKVFDSSPAEKAGLKALDLVVEANGSILRWIDRGLKMRELGLESRNSIEVLVQRQVALGSANANTTEFRKLKISPSLFLKSDFTNYKVSANLESWLVIRITQFDIENLCSKFIGAIHAGENDRVTGIVLDLRGNRGGKTEALPCLGGALLGPAKTVYYQKAIQQGSQEIEVKTIGEKVTNLPVVVLQDARTASSSEFFIAALRDYGRAMIIGTNSYGKANLQSCVEPLALPGLYQCRLVGFVYSPAGFSHQNEGIKPDFLFYRDLDPSEEELYALRERDLSLYPVLSQPLQGSRVQSEFLNSSEFASLASSQVFSECLKTRRSQLLKGGSLSLEQKGDFQLLSAVSALSCQERAKDRVKNE